MPKTTVSRARALAGRILAEAAFNAYCLERLIRDSAGAVAWALWFESRPLCRAPGRSRWWFTERERAMLVALLELAVQNLRRERASR